MSCLAWVLVDSPTVFMTDSHRQSEYAVQNFTNANATQATLTQIEQFMDVTTSWMESVDYVERYFWFGAMYEMVRLPTASALLTVPG
jgi:hypothetical protein